MSEMLTALPGILSGKAGQGIGTLAQLIAGGSGVIGNILKSHEASKRQKMLDDLARNPQKLAALIRQAQQPLSQGLVQDVTNQAQAQLAERGLGTSPQIAAAVEGQALAPYELKAQEDAQRAVFDMLGLSTGAPSALPSGPADTSGFWRMFQPSPDRYPWDEKPGISTYPTTPSSPSSSGGAEIGGID